VLAGTGLAARGRVASQSHSPEPPRPTVFDGGRTASWTYDEEMVRGGKGVPAMGDEDTERRVEEVHEVPGPGFDLTDTTQVEQSHIFGVEQDVHIGTRLGAYDIVRRLARGGMGVVYLGLHVRLGRKVAIKLPHPHVLRDGDLRRRFLSEAMAAVQISHPGVVNVLDYGHSADDTPYLVMELLEGASLAERMSHGALPIDMAVGVASRVADTLAAAHEAGVIHRDLKPENVFLQRHRHRPERLTVKVLDFGFAKLLGGPAAGGIAPCTQQGLVIGTPCYMSPEQCLGFAPVDHRSDIYSLGCILYEMVAGRLPFSGALSEVKLALRYRPAVPPRWHNRELPDELDSLIMKMLAKLPADRPVNMVELSRSLERIGARRASSRRAPTAEVDPEAGSSPVRRGLRVEVRRPTGRPRTARET
jgi:serine/threonine protein kinase